MSASPRSGEHDQIDRHPSIVEAARELAEAEGWEAVTPRRLADRIGCDQLTLYRHFASTEAIVVAVAVRGFAELAAALEQVRVGVPQAAGAWAAVAEAYLDFAYANPGVYDAMFLLTADLPFGVSEASAPLHAVFVAFRAALAPSAAGRDLDALAEVGWSVLHGMVMLTRGGRLRPDLQERREALIADQLFGASAHPESSVDGPEVAGD